MREILLKSLTFSCLSSYDSAVTHSKRCKNLCNIIIIDEILLVNNHNKLLM